LVCQIDGKFWLSPVVGENSLFSVTRIRHLRLP
jgi:hypothetical protein